MPFVQFNQFGRGMESELKIKWTLVDKILWFFGFRSIERSVKFNKYLKQCEAVTKQNLQNNLFTKFQKKVKRKISDGLNFNRKNNFFIPLEIRVGSLSRISEDKCALDRNKVVNWIESLNCGNIYIVPGDYSKYFVYYYPFDQPEFLDCLIKYDEWVKRENSISENNLLYIDLR